MSGSGAMIAPDYVRLMARYGAWRNAALVAEAAALDDAARRAERGAFFGSIHGTLSHLVWADATWLSRFDGAPPPPPGGIAASGGMWVEWPALTAERARLDAAISVWADRVTEQWLASTLRWFSGAAGREVEKPAALCVVHFFNHATHHRGQVHAMLTAAGARTADTDLFLMPEADAAPAA